MGFLENYKIIKITITLISIYFFLLPMDSILVFSNESILKFYSFGIIFFILMFVLHRKTLKLNKVIAITLSLSALSFVSILWSVDYQRALSINQYYILTPVFFILILQIPYSTKDYFMLEYFYFLGGLTYTILLLSEYGFNFESYNRLVYNDKTDPNGIALSLLIPLIIAVKLSISSKFNIKKIFYFLSSIAMFFVIFYTGSRTAFLSLLIIMFLSFIIFTKLSIKNMILFSFIVVGFILVLRSIPDELYLRMFDLDNILINESISSDSRISIWRNIFSYLVPNMPLYGYGAGGGTIMLSHIYGYLKGVHNTYLSVFLDFGFFGITLFLMLIMTVLRYLHKNNDKLGKIIFIGVMVAIFFLDRYGNKWLWSVLAFILLKPPAKFSHLKPNLIKTDFSERIRNDDNTYQIFQLNIDEK